MESNLPIVGTFIRIIRQPADPYIVNVVGLYGWISYVCPIGHVCFAELLCPTTKQARLVEVNAADYIVVIPTTRMRKLYTTWRANLVQIPEVSTKKNKPKSVLKRRKLIPTAQEFGAIDEALAVWRELFEWYKCHGKLDVSQRARFKAASLQLSQFSTPTTL